MSFTDVFKKIFGTKADRDMKAIRPTLNKVLEAYKTIDLLSDDELRDRCQALKDKIQAEIAQDEARIAQIKEELEKDIPLSQKETLATEQDKLVKKVDETIEKVLDEILPEAFAIMKSTARRFAQNTQIRVKATQFDRDLSTSKEFVTIDGDYAVWQNHWMAGGNEMTWDMVHYDVQLIGGIVLHQGKIAEMATGEGKTLVATLPVFLNALAGKGVHVVTVNDYLSKRDSEWMGPLYMFHGLSVDCIDKHQPNSEARKKAYACNITFGTNNEFGFDYLRDNMSTSMKDLVQKKHHFAIVDEVDSVLIDDEEKFIGNERHLTLVVLNIIILHLLQELLHTRLAEELDQRLVFRIALVCSEKKYATILFVTFSNKFPCLVEKLVDESLLIAVETLHKRLVLHKLLILTFRNRAGNDQRGTSIINEH